MYQASGYQEVFLDVVIQEARVNFQGGMRLDTCQVQVLLFADDTVIVAEAEEHLDYNTNALQEAVKEHTLAEDWGKTHNGIQQRAHCLSGRG